MATRQEGLQAIIDKFGDDILDAADITGLDPLVLTGLIYTESGGDPNAVSPKNAHGLTQMLPATAAEVAQRVGYTDFTDPGDLVQKMKDDPGLAVMLGAVYFKDQMDRANGDPLLAWSMYHDGPNSEASLAGKIGPGPKVQAGVAHLGDVLDTLGWTPQGRQPTAPPPPGNSWEGMTAGGGLPEQIPGRSPDAPMPEQRDTRRVFGSTPNPMTTAFDSGADDSENFTANLYRGLATAGSLGYYDPMQGEDWGKSGMARAGAGLGLGWGTGLSFLPANVATGFARAAPYVGRALQPALAFALHSGAQKVQGPEGMSGADALRYQLAERAKAAGKGAVTGAALAGVGMIPGVAKLAAHPVGGPLVDTATLTGLQAIEGQPIDLVNNLAFAYGMRGAGAVTEPMMPKSAREIGMERGKKQFEAEQQAKAKADAEAAAIEKLSAEMQARNAQRQADYEAMRNEQWRSGGGQEALRAQMAPEQQPLALPPASRELQFLSGSGATPAEVGARMAGRGAPAVAEGQGAVPAPPTDPRRWGMMRQVEPLTPPPTDPFMPSVSDQTYRARAAVEANRSTPPPVDTRLVGLEPGAPPTNPMRPGVPYSPRKSLGYTEGDLSNAVAQGRRLFRKPYGQVNPEEPFTPAGEVDIRAQVADLLGIEQPKPPKRKGGRSRSVTLDAMGGQQALDAAGNLISGARSRREAAIQRYADEYRAQLSKEGVPDPKQGGKRYYPPMPAGQRVRPVEGVPASEPLARYVNREGPKEDAIRAFTENPDLLNPTPETLRKIVEGNIGNLTTGEAVLLDRRRALRRIEGGDVSGPIKRNVIELGQLVERAREMMNDDFQMDFKDVLDQAGIKRGSKEAKALGKFLWKAFPAGADPVEAAKTKDGQWALEGIADPSRILKAAVPLREKMVEMHGLRVATAEMVSGKGKVRRAAQGDLEALLSDKGIKPGSEDAAALTRFLRLYRSASADPEAIALTKPGQRALKGATDPQTIIDAARQIVAKARMTAGVRGQALRDSGIEAGSEANKAVTYLLRAAAKTGASPEIAAQSEAAQARLKKFADPKVREAIIKAAETIHGSALGKKEFASAARAAIRGGTKSKIGYVESYFPQTERRYSWIKEPIKRAEQWSRPEERAYGPIKEPSLWSPREQRRAIRSSLRIDQINFDPFDVLAKYSADASRMFNNSIALHTTNGIVKAMRETADQYRKAGDSKRAREIEATSDALSAINQMSYNGKMFGPAAAHIDFMSGHRGTKAILNLELQAKQMFNVAKYTLPIPFIVLRQWTSLGLVPAHADGTFTPAMMARAIYESGTPRLGQEWKNSYTHWIKNRKRTLVTREGTLVDDSMVGALDKGPGLGGKARWLVDYPISLMENFTGRMAYAMAEQIAIKANMNPVARAAFASDVAGMTQSYYDKVNRAPILSEPGLNLFIPAQSFAIESMNTARQIRRGESGTAAKQAKNIRAQQAFGTFAALFAANLAGVWALSYKRNLESEGEDPLVPSAGVLTDNLTTTAGNFVPYASGALGLGISSQGMYPQQVTKGLQRSLDYAKKGDYNRAVSVIGKDVLPGGSTFKRFMDAYDLEKKGVIEFGPDWLTTALFGTTATEPGAAYIKKKLHYDQPETTGSGQGYSRQRGGSSHRQPYRQGGGYRR